LWIALVSVALLAAYAKARTYGLLVVGGLLGGTAAGILLQQAFPSFDGVFLIALGASLVAIDRVEPREPRWPRFVGLALAGWGWCMALTTTGVLGSAWFAVLLIAVGAPVLWRSARRRRSRHRSSRLPPSAAPAGAPDPPSAPASTMAGERTAGGIRRRPTD
jgi:uncharacterized membrane protein YfcA